jgi:hypothetical protein
MNIISKNKNIINLISSMLNQKEEAPINLYGVMLKLLKVEETICKAYVIFVYIC